jgi:putative membrane protein
MKNARPIHLILLVIVIIVGCWSGWHPHDRLTWWLEVTPGLLGIIILLTTYQRFEFTTLCYVLIAAHIGILCVGGHYTYARVPAFDWLRTTFDWQRNHYDRLGHFVQGFVPAIIARELFIRLDVLNRKNWLPFIIVALCLTVSALYELMEWLTAAIVGSASDDFIGSQGDVWDTQKDMFFALIGSICALLFLSHLHDRALQRIAQRTR